MRCLDLTDHDEDYPDEIKNISVPKQKADEMNAIVARYDEIKKQMEESNQEHHLDIGQFNNKVSLEEADDFDEAQGRRAFANMIEKGLKKKEELEEKARQKIIDQQAKKEAAKVKKAAQKKQQQQKEREEKQNKTAQQMVDQAPTSTFFKKRRGGRGGRSAI